MSAYRAKHRAAGLCSDCPRKAEAGRTQCTRCYESHLQRKRRRYHSLAASGICPQCGENETGVFRLCRPCRSRNAETLRDWRARTAVAA